MCPCPVALPHYNLGSEHSLCVDLALLVPQWVLPKTVETIIADELEFFFNTCKVLCYNTNISLIIDSKDIFLPSFLSMYQIILLWFLLYESVCF